MERAVARMVLIGQVGRNKKGVHDVIGLGDQVQNGARLAVQIPSAAIKASDQWVTCSRQPLTYLSCEREMSLAKWTYGAQCGK